MRIGQGVDVHAFASHADRPLALGGITIAGEASLAGHSDGDVALHALTDALLGAAGLGDLGGFVGVDDPAVAGASSRRFLVDAARAVADRGWTVANGDLTIVAQRPRLAAHLPAMRAAIAADLGLPETAVNVKATSTDHLGFLGRGEGIAALAVVLLRSAGEGPQRA